MASKKDINLIVHQVPSGEHVASLSLSSSVDVADLRHAILQEMGMADSSRPLRLLFGSEILQDGSTLTEVKLTDGATIGALHGMPTLDMFRLQAWAFLENGARHRATDLECVRVHCGSAGDMAHMAFEGAAVKPDEDKACLLRISSNFVEVLEGEEMPHEAIKAAGVAEAALMYPNAIQVIGAGLPDVNGIFVRDGDWNKQPRWKLSGSQIWLRYGSDQNWCIVNNPNGRSGSNAGTKQFFYACLQSEQPVDGHWLPDQHGLEPSPSLKAVGPLEMFEPEIEDSLFQMALREEKDAMQDSMTTSQKLLVAIAKRESVLVAAPKLPVGYRPIVLHVHHFSHATHLWASATEVDDRSFRGFDDEQISAITSDVWRYIGK